MLTSSSFILLRHFLACCSRMLGLSYQSKRGYIGLEYYGRTVSIKILPVGIHIGQLQFVLNLPETEAKVAELRNKFRGQTVMLGVDDIDIFKGISLKLLAMEQLLMQHTENTGEVVLVQSANPLRGRGRDVQEIRSETYATVRRINNAFGRPGDGMNLIPYEYVICRQGNEKLDEARGLHPSTPKRSMLVVSELIGCSPSLSGAIRVNPWNIDAVVEAMDSALILSEGSTTGSGAGEFDTGDPRQMILSSCRIIAILFDVIIGFSLGFRVVAMDPNFRKLSAEHIVSAYKRTKNRPILLDYDSTLQLTGSLSTIPNVEAVGILNNLCRDPKNVVFLVSGKDRKTLTEWFSSYEKLGIAAENGYFIRVFFPVALA
ncbi:Alpha,alpha-trehalose-phosphate synthase 6 [Hibiscus syriacus]|uniref:Alpha,alpha-trehalose-phosphate synthase 6 n=1 Tax=Hibiscus syriacus TaxID=106335 RepID=A0A6A3AHT5_HIBSY|nr:Alpha,alpha-trehalose-phosphate synthase 6 [Hibiscus syriacus]